MTKIKYENGWWYGSVLNEYDKMMKKEGYFPSNHVKFVENVTDPLKYWKKPKVKKESD